MEGTEGTKEQREGKLQPSPGWVQAGQAESNPVKPSRGKSDPVQVGRKTKMRQSRKRHRSVCVINYIRPNPT